MTLVHAGAQVELPKHFERPTLIVVVKADQPNPVGRPRTARAARLCRRRHRFD